MLSQEWLSFKDIHDIFTYKDFSIDYRDTAEIITRCFDNKNFDIYYTNWRFEDYKDKHKFLNNQKIKTYLSTNNRVISKWYKKDIHKKYSSKRSKLLTYLDFNLINRSKLKVISGGVSYNTAMKDRGSCFIIDSFELDSLTIEFKQRFDLGDGEGRANNYPNFISADVDEYLSIYVKAIDFILYFNDILELNHDNVVNTFIPNQFDPREEYKNLKPNEFLIKEYLARDILNLEELALIFKYFGINYDAGDVYNSLQCFDIDIEENVDIPEVDTKDFIATYKDVLGLEPYIIDKKALQPQLAINQDDSYKYSQALKPYNDIILAFADSTEYKKYYDSTTKKDIEEWLETNYKEYFTNGRFKYVFADLIFKEYGLTPKTGVNANKKTNS